MEKLVFFIKAKRYERNKASPYLQGSNMHFPYSREPLSAGQQRCLLVESLYNIYCS